MSKQDTATASESRRRLLSTDEGHEAFHVGGTTSIGIDVGGTVVTMPLAEWHAAGLALRATAPEVAQEPAVYVNRTQLDLVADRFPVVGFKTQAEGFDVPLFAGPALRQEPAAPSERTAFEDHRETRTGQRPEAVWNGGKHMDPPPLHPLPGRYSDHTDNEAWHAWQAARASRAAPQEDAELQTLRDRDAYHEWADRLANAIAQHFDADIGEHSSDNNPWKRAEDAIFHAAKPAAQQDDSKAPAALTDAAIDAGVAALRDEIGYGHNGDAHAAVRAIMLAAAPIPAHEAASQGQQK